MFGAFTISDASPVLPCLLRRKDSSYSYSSASLEKRAVSCGLMYCVVDVNYLVLPSIKRVEERYPLGCKITQ